MSSSKGSRKSRMLKGLLPLSGLVALAIMSLSVGKPPAPQAKVVQSPPTAVPTAPIQSTPPVKMTKSMIKTTSQNVMNPVDLAAYQQAIRETALMVSDPEAQRLAALHALQILNLTWEDTGRYKGSAVGPNISDMTIQVALKDPKTQQLAVTCMPVIRLSQFRGQKLRPRPSRLHLVGGQPLWTGIEAALAVRFSGSANGFPFQPQLLEVVKEDLAGCARFQGPRERPGLLPASSQKGESRIQPSPLQLPVV